MDSEQTEREVEERKLILRLETELERDRGDNRKKANLALIYAEVGRKEDALRLYEEMLPILPEDPEILVNLGFCLMGDDDMRAMDLFKKVFERAKKEPVNSNILSAALTNMGVIGERRNHLSDAHDYYRVALQVRPENPLAREYLNELERKAEEDEGLVFLFQHLDGRTGFIPLKLYFRLRLKLANITFK